MYQNRNPGKNKAQAIVDTMEVNAAMSIDEIVSQTDEVDDPEKVRSVLVQLLMQGYVDMTGDMEYIVPRPPAS